MHSYVNHEDISVRTFFSTSDHNELFHLTLSKEAHAEVQEVMGLLADHQMDVITHDSWTYKHAPNSSPANYVDFS